MGIYAELGKLDPEVAENLLEMWVRDIAMGVTGKTWAPVALPEEPKRDG